MLATPSRHVLVLGTAWANARKQHAARMIGSMLAEYGFGLVCGDSSGIDRWVADSYSTALARAQQPLSGHFTQLAMGAARFWRRGGMPWGNHPAPAGCRVRITSVEAWKCEAVARCDAAVMLGGGRGALDIAQRCIAHGKPVFPLPFHGGLTGNSDQVFQEILRGWGDHPVPGLSRGQFLRLAEPWVVGTGPLGTLLRGTLAEVPEVFVSYRRNDAASAAGRLAAGLQEHLGHRRVFLDLEGIRPAQAWADSIGAALSHCRVGVVVIGPRWLAPGADGGTPRLQLPDDVLRREVATLLASGKTVVPVLVDGARLPEADALPSDLAMLPRLQTLTIGQGDWEATFGLLLRTIDAVLEQPNSA